MVDGGSLGTDRLWWMVGVKVQTDYGDWWESRYRQSMVDGGSQGTDRPW